MLFTSGMRYNVKQHKSHKSGRNRNRKKEKLKSRVDLPLIRAGFSSTTRQPFVDLTYSAAMAAAAAVEPSCGVWKK
jgi:hypothetical protein